MRRTTGAAMPTDPPEIDLTALHAAVLAEPGCDTVRLAFADELDARAGPGDAERAEFIRTQVRLAAASCNDFPHGHDRPGDDTCGVCERYRADQQRVGELLAGDYGRRWRQWAGAAIAVIPPGGNYTEHVEFARGFVSLISCGMADFLTHAPRVFAAQPVDEVRIADREPWVMSSPVLRYGWCDDSQDFPSVRWHVPLQVFGHLPPTDPGLPGNPHRRWYRTEERALDALSAACVKFGRRSAGGVPPA